MTFHLENNFLKASFKSLGAELCSLVNIKNNTEHIWQANPKVWARHAPILFPIVGQVEKNTYRIDEREFTLSQHGFARDRQFDVENQTNDSITFLLKSDLESLKVYPFQFELRIVYTLEKKKLNIKYEVLNTDQQTIWFSIGAHPGFICPFSDGEAFSDYELVFEKAETAEKMLFSEGLLNGLTTPFLQNDKIISLNYKLFEDDAIILEKLKSAYVDLMHRSNGNTLRFHFKGFPLLAFWTKPGANADFLCIEPWFGLADVKGANKDFRERPFMEKLEMGKKFECEYGIELFL